MIEWVTTVFIYRDLWSITMAAHYTTRCFEPILSYTIITRSPRTPTHPNQRSVAENTGLGNEGKMERGLLWTPRKENDGLCEINASLSTGTNREKTSAWADFTMAGGRWGGDGLVTWRHRELDGHGTLLLADRWMNSLRWNLFRVSIWSNTS